LVSLWSDIAEPVPRNDREIFFRKDFVSGHKMEYKKKFNIVCPRTKGLWVVAEQGDLRCPS